MVNDLGSLPTTPRRANRELWERSALWHGQPKIGKSTLAAQFPKPLFISTEDGLGALDVYEVPIYDQTKKVKVSANTIKETFIESGWERFQVVLHDLKTQPHDFQTLVIDTVDRLFLNCVKWHTVRHEVEYENDGILGFGKGGNMIARNWAETLTIAQRLPLGLILISHSEEKEVADLGTSNKGPKKVRVVSTLPKKAVQIVNGMVDMIFYFTFDADGNRVIKTRACPHHDAGSRIGTLPETIGMSYDAIAQAYTEATKGQTDRNTIDELIARIHRGEQWLAEKKIDSFDTEKRKVNSRTKHAGDADLHKCGFAGLESYLQHLQVKAKGVTNEYSS